LGLALTRRLVEAQGGIVGVKSEPGVGSVFHLVLPRQTEGVASAPLASHAMPLDSSRMLVIAEDQPRLDRLVQALNDAGFRADGVSSGHQAVSHAREHTYDAITLELHLPDVKGLVALADIRSDGLSRGTPVVSMTLPADHGAAASFAISDVLSKPLHIAEVVQAMQRLELPLNRSCRVLVVDDDPLALDLMHSTLTDIGITPICVPGGRAALAEISRQAPDAIILDLMMPEFDGFAVLDALRHLPDGRDIPVFIWTSMMLSDDEYEHLARSAREILSKGGGEFALMLETLRRWRPPTLTLTKEGS
jgi:CheY-like chemotaxis protein